MTESRHEIESALNSYQHDLPSRLHCELDYLYNKIQQDVQEEFSQNSFSNDFHDLPLLIQAGLVGRLVKHTVEEVQDTFSSGIFEELGDPSHQDCIEYFGLKIIQTQWSGSPQIEFPAADENKSEKMSCLEQRIKELSSGSLKELDPTHMLVLSIVLAKILYPGISDSAELVPMAALIYAFLKDIQKNRG